MSNFAVRSEADLHAALRLRRLELRLSQRALAERMGVHQSLVATLESAHNPDRKATDRSSRLVTIEKWAAALGVDLAYTGTVQEPVREEPTPDDTTD